MKYLFLGAGAIGTYLGGSLAARGEDVTFVDQPAVVGAIRLNGLHLERGGTARTEHRFRAFTSDAEALASGPYDVCVFALKSFDTGTAVDQLVATGEEVPPILSVQNGVDNEATIAERLGADRVIAGTVCSAIARPAVGRVVEEKHRGVGIALGHELSERLVASFDRAELGARAYERSGPMKWSKLLTNLTGNATSAILDLPPAALFADDRLFDVEIATLRECLAVMDALGYRPVDLPGTPVRALVLGTRVPRFIAQPVMTRMLGTARGHKMPSFHIDLYSGRGKSEVGWLNGAIAAHGERLGVPTPVNRVLTDTLQGLTDGTLGLGDFRHRPDALLRLLP